ncbi:hypothetical protein HPG69_012259 [Diceros bicornis minor]|uniref:Transcription factor BTF3 n=1 Tax=Diceros bicornis minor TaxID=77932 RepID=A0A7J7F558_DICBM|nr:hypothetical protein HPG69_012259 [Diceros bicornis minor]
MKIRTRSDPFQAQYVHQKRFTNSMNQEKLAKLQAQVRIGGKGTARRKKKVVHRTATADDKKLQSSLKKLAVNNIAGIEEIEAEVLDSKAPKPEDIDEEDDDVPDLVENFDEASKNEAN